MPTNRLIIYTPNEMTRNLYKNEFDTGRNSGFDLYLPDDTVFAPKKVTVVNFDINTKTINERGETVGYWLAPRSSIFKTPLRMANSIGLIDADYRGCILALLENTSDTEFVAPKGMRLVQVVQADLHPFRVEWSTTPLDSTARGSGGLGSTGT